MRVLLVALALLTLGCAEDSIRFRVLALTEPDPYLGADRVAVALEQDGELVPPTERTFAPDAPEWRLDGLPYAADLQLRVEARSGDVVLARGRSFLFDATLGAPAAPVDVSLGALGRFGRSVDATPATAPRAVVPWSGGAIWAEASGAIVRYVAHGPDGHAYVERIGTGPRDASWVGIEGVGLLAIDGDTASLHGWDGARIAHVADGVIAALGAGPALVPLDDGVVAIGGQSSAAVVRLRLVGDAIEVVPLGALPAPGAVRACAFALTPDEVAVVAVGPAGGWVIDPETGSSRPLPSPSYPASAAVVPLQRGFVAVVGGEVAGVPVDVVTLLVLRPDSEQQLDAQPLFGARRDAAVVPLRDGLALIAGGVGPAGPLASAELLERALGEISPTGAMPAPSAHAVGTALEDGTVLVLGDGGVSLYFVPR